MGIVTGFEVISSSLLCAGHHLITEPFFDSLAFSTEKVWTFMNIFIIVLSLFAITLQEFQEWSFESEAVTPVKSY